MKRRVDVTLFGHRFTVRTEKDEAYVHDLATHVGQRIDDLRRQLRTASREELALLVALNLADELFESATRHACLRDEMRRHTDAMVGKLTEFLAGTDAQGSQRSEPMQAAATAAPAHQRNLPADAPDDDEPILVLDRSSLRRA